MSNLTKKIDSLLELDAKGALSPHGIGGLARELLEKCKAELNTRAVPDVPELVRLSAVKRYGREEVIESDENGEYVTYDQAAAVIAAKDNELALKDTGLKIAMSKIAALEAKLAQIEKQEAVALIGSGWQLLYVNAASMSEIVEKHKLTIGAKLYAAPVSSDADLKAENERLKQREMMIVSHATMGGTTGEGLSVNEISVRITALRNEMYQAGKEAALNPSEPRA